MSSLDVMIDLETTGIAAGCGGEHEIVKAAKAAGDRFSRFGSSN